MTLYSSHFVSFLLCKSYIWVAGSVGTSMTQSGFQRPGKQNKRNTQIINNINKWKSRKSKQIVIDWQAPKTQLSWHIEWREFNDHFLDLYCPYCSQLFKLFTKLCLQHQYHYLCENIKLLPACFSLFLKQLRWVSGSMWYGTRKIRSQSSKKELTVLPEKRTSLQSPFRKDTSDCIFNAFQKVKLL